MRNTIIIKKANEQVIEQPPLKEKPVQKMGFCFFPLKISFSRSDPATDNHPPPYFYHYFSFLAKAASKKTIVFFISASKLIIHNS